MDPIAEYLIKSNDFPKLLSTLLQEKIVDKIISAQERVDKKTNAVDRFTITPKLIDKPKDAENFPLSNFIAYGYARTDSAAKYLHKSVGGAKDAKIGLIARPCDTRALIELAKIKQVELDNLFIIGIEDRGMVINVGRELKKMKDIDPSKIVKEKIVENGLIFKLDDGKTKEVEIQPSENCLRCTRKIPVIADLNVSDIGIPIDSDEIILKIYSEKGNDLLEKSKINKKPLPDDIKSANTDEMKQILEKAKEKRKKDLEEWAKIPQEEKIERLLKCTMCGMCIRGCPVCYCVDCILAKKRKEKTINKETYQLTRVAHVADRCVECGNCYNNCPQNLPLSLYFMSLNEAFNEKFGYCPGESIDDIPFRSGKAIREMELERV
ncbi:MAG: Coenzyme F420 hydrogenase/dehydrogenase, beta subunit C-terminal domain [Promethearchaeota archaeon]